MSRESEIYACLCKSTPGLNVEMGLVIFYYPSFLLGSSYLNCPLAHFTFVLYYCYLSPLLWPSNVKRQCIRKDPDAGKD